MFGIMIKSSIVCAICKEFMIARETGVCQLLFHGRSVENTALGRKITGRANRNYLVMLPPFASF